MNWSSLRRRMPVVGCALALFLAGCDGGVEGEYEGDGAPMDSLVLEDGKAKVKMGDVTLDGTYTVDGDKVTVTIAGDAEVLTRQSDGSLTGDPGTFKKK